MTLHSGLILMNPKCQPGMTVETGMLSFLKSQTLHQYFYYLVLRHIWNPRFYNNDLRLFSCDLVIYC